MKRCVECTRVSKFSECDPFRAGWRQVNLKETRLNLLFFALYVTSALVGSFFLIRSFLMQLYDPPMVNSVESQFSNTVGAGRFIFIVGQSGGLLGDPSCNWKKELQNQADYPCRAGNYTSV